MVEPSELFGPISWLQLEVASGKKEAVKKASPRFPTWSGESPGSNYGGKPIVDYNGRPAFAELAILWTLADAGWNGVWVTHAGGKEKHRRGFWGDQEPFQVVTTVLDLLSRVRGTRGDTSKGTWDIVCWPQDATLVELKDLRFVESKWGGKDSIKADQIDWFRHIRDSGIPRESFLIIEWNLGSARPSV